MEMEIKYFNKAEFEKRFVDAVMRRICELSKSRDLESIEKSKSRIMSILDLAEELNILELDHISYLLGEMYQVVEDINEAEMSHV